VLSACETAIGDDRAPLGLAGIALKSGARSTIASLWKVNDTATSLLMQRFYKELATRQVTKAEALQKAQQAILADPQFRRHPYFWAPFILVGNWL
jgi:CHAT domain-containing protein